MINNRTIDFRTKRLNQKGMVKSNNIAIALDIVWQTMMDSGIDNSPEKSIIEEHLELASYFARKALAKKPELQHKPDVKEQYRELESFA